MQSLIISQNFEPYFNLAIENHLFETSRDKNLLYLWRNSDVVVIGRFQNPWKECNLKKMEDDSVSLMRRDTGGGAVFQDIHNICFTFIGEVTEHNKDSYKEENTAKICAALATLGISAYGSGRNDILVNEQKISGAAYREKNGRYIHHGTLMVGTDLSRLAAYLNPDAKKLSAKGISSVRSRVTNLRAVDNTITMDLVIKALSDICITENPNLTPQFINTDILNTQPLLKTDYERLKSKEWRYGKTPHFTHSIDGRFDWGGIEIQLTVKNALIKEIDVYSDGLDTTLVPTLKTLLEQIRNTHYNTEKIAGILKTAGFEDIARLF